jgi:hypothetical protein
MADDLLERLRRICLALPEATEKIAWGEPTFRVRDKLFAMFDNNHHGAGRVAVWVKAAKDVQEILVGADPQRFFVPPYVGPKGWIGVRLDLDNVDWSELADIVRDGYRMTAPPRIAALLEGRAADDGGAATAQGRQTIKNKPATRARRPKPRSMEGRALRRRSGQAPRDR